MTRAPRPQHGSWHRPRRPWWCDRCGGPTDSNRALYCRGCTLTGGAVIGRAEFLQCFQEAVVSGVPAAVLAEQLGYRPEAARRRLYRLGRPDLAARFARSSQVAA